jgi:DNA-binding PadR family transcriptional regulator
MTAATSLRPFSFVVLALVGEDGAGPHDLVRMMRRGRVYWAASNSHYYAEPKRLAALGFLTAEREPGRTGERTHYRLTERGREALRAWIAEPSTFPRIQHEAVVRLLAADVSDEATVRRSLGAMRADLAELSAGLDLAGEQIPALPHRARYLPLVHDLGRSLVEVHERWLDRVERALSDERADREA